MARELLPTEEELLATLKLCLQLLRLISTSYDPSVGHGRRQAAPLLADAPGAEPVVGKAGRASFASLSAVGGDAT